MKNYDKYLRIPFKHQGNSFDGADCIGLVDLFFVQELGIKVPLPALEYERDWWKKESLVKAKLSENEFSPVDIINLALQHNFEPTVLMGEGTVLFFKNTTKICGHVGVAISEHEFLHMTDHGAVISSILRFPYANNTQGMYRLNEESARAYSIR